MAIDTTEKKLSAISFRIGWICPLLPVADGSIDQGDKQHLLRLYSGILAGPLVQAQKIIHKVKGIFHTTIKVKGVFHTTAKVKGIFR
jgi:hypothetical protein